MQNKRRGGRSTRALDRNKRPSPFKTLVRNVPVYEVLNEEGVELVHMNSLSILSEIGIEFRDPESLDLWKKAGADVHESRVRIAPELVMSLVAKAPSEYTMHGRNPERTVIVGNDNMIICPTYGCPYVIGMDGERRYGTLNDLYNFHKLAHQLPVMHMSGGLTCEPVDVAVPKRYLHTIYGLLKWSDKPFMGATLGTETAQDTMNMAAIVFGEKFVRDNTVMTSVLNCNSPLVWDSTMLDALKVYARSNQAVLCTPFVMPGANAPLSTVGAMAQLNAEALAGIAFMQLLRPGSPSVYGNLVLGISMKTGAPMFGTPELNIMNYIAGQLARKYRIPWRSSAMITGSKVLDIQAGYESVMTTAAVMRSGANYIMHAAGALEASIAVSYAKFVLDAEIMEMFYREALGPTFADFEEAMGAVRDVGPGGHFMGAQHTQDHYEAGFYVPQLMDCDPYEHWVEGGALDATARGNRLAQKLLDTYEEPALDSVIAEQLDDYVSRRDAELGSTVH